MSAKSFILNWADENMPDGTIGESLKSLLELMENIPVSDQVHYMPSGKGILGFPFRLRTSILSSVGGEMAYASLQGHPIRISWLDDLRRGITGVTGRENCSTMSVSMLSSICSTPVYYKQQKVIEEGEEYDLKTLYALVGVVRDIIQQSSAYIYSPSEADTRERVKAVCHCYGATIQQLTTLLAPKYCDVEVALRRSVENCSRYQDWDAENNDLR